MGSAPSTPFRDARRDAREVGEAIGAVGTRLRGKGVLTEEGLDEFLNVASYFDGWCAPRIFEEVQRALAEHRASSGTEARNQ